MPAALDIPPSKPVLVSDFDGTMTRHDFYQLVMDRLLPTDTPNFWVQYRAGAIIHFDALAKTFAAAPAGEDALIELARDQDLDPDLAPELARLRAEGWEVVVISAGCAWYIDRHLRAAGVDLEVHANPGHIEDDRLIMEWPTGSPFYSPQTGIDKVAVVREAMEGGRVVAFAGDGPPDLEPALLVRPELRFARRGKALADALTERGERFHPFDRWSEVVRVLLLDDEAGG